MSKWEKELAAVELVEEEQEQAEEPRIPRARRPDFVPHQIKIQVVQQVQRSPGVMLVLM